MVNIWLIMVNIWLMMVNNNLVQASSPSTSRVRHRPPSPAAPVPWHRPRPPRPGRRAPRRGARRATGAAAGGAPRNRLRGPG